MVSIEDVYQAKKEAFIRKDIPFLSYLHKDYAGNAGYQFIRTDEVKWDPKVPRYPPCLKFDDLQITKSAKQSFERIVRNLGKAGILRDVTRHLQD